uniref:Secreted protein n=1 Tax=Setaria viridis TaxID=4556 RepID=A0A4U6TC94_SETVI|nr:hypothetical protein SEVIR_8G014400v2 [Setaria viridis]
MFLVRVCAWCPRMLVACTAICRSGRCVCGFGWSSRESNFCAFSCWEESFIFVVNSMVT